MSKNGSIRSLDSVSKILWPNGVMGVLYVYEWLCVDELDAQRTRCAVWSFSDSGPLASASASKHGYIMMKIPLIFKAPWCTIFKKAIMGERIKCILIAGPFKVSGK